MNHGPEEDRAGKENNTSLSICPLFLFSVFLLLLCASSLTLHPLPVPPLHKPSPSLISRPFVMLRKPPGLTLVYCLLSMRMQLCIHHGLYFLFVFFCLFVCFFFCSSNLHVISLLSGWSLSVTFTFPFFSTVSTSKEKLQFVQCLLSFLLQSSPSSTLLPLLLRRGFSSGEPRFDWGQDLNISGPLQQNPPKWKKCLIKF